uniref:Ferrous iron transporter B n=1 Tax=candidate division WOR-3 bacterium TaxID=2052148 RepID=A0A7C4UDI8_UNCW3
MKKILLVGNPNVGKSVIFSRLTGVDVIVSNYPGTTVEYLKGNLSIGDEKIEVVDVPGTYSLEPTSPAEEVAVNMLKKSIEEKDSIILNIIDSTNLERNLNLTLQVLQLDIPVIVVLNFWDEVKHIGIKIDVKRLEEILGVPVFTTCAISGEGIKELITNLNMAKKGSLHFKEKDRWKEVGKIVGEVQRITHKHHTFLEKLQEWTIHPQTAIPISIVLVFIFFYIIRFIGEGLINFLLDPFFNNILIHPISFLSKILSFNRCLHNIFIGELIDGKIDYKLSFGLLTTGLYVEFGQVLPYVFSFYLVLSFLEDSGYLPRLAVIFDRIMHIVGLHGMGIIPMLLGFGCNVPGILSTRILETRRARFIAITLMSISIPCMSLTAMIFGLLGKYGIKGILPVYLTLFLIWLTGGMIMKFFSKGEVPEIFLEIPPYRIPYFKGMMKKVWIRIKWFIKDATPYVLLGIFIVNILYTFKIIDFMGRITGKFFLKFFSIPPEAAVAIIVGFLRKDVAVGMLAPLNLGLKQLVISTTMLAISFPCAATFATILKEIGLKDLLKSTGIMLITAFITGILLNLIIP